MNELVVIRIRGPAKVKKDIEETLQRLKLKDNNNCSIVKNSPDMIGMLNKAKDYITWGVLDDEMKNALAQKEEGRHFRLHPPRGGFERKGIKKSFSIGGALGDRKEKINMLIKRML